jgi:hypothetical protein
VGTTSPDGPHVSPLWFGWDGEAIWLYSIVKSQRWTDLERDPRVAIVVDAGEAYGELRGVELRGPAERIGEVPRTGSPDPALADVERLYARKYHGGDALDLDGRHAWLRVVPTRIVSWDFRKLPPDRR